MYERLLAAGARGHVCSGIDYLSFRSRERLTKRYHRAWCFWQSVSSAVLDRIRPQPTAYVLGVPRYFYGRALRGMLQLVNIRNREPASRFSNELSLWELAGFFYGKHFTGRIVRQMRRFTGCPVIFGYCRCLIDYVWYRRVYRLLGRDPMGATRGRLLKTCAIVIRHRGPDDDGFLR